MKRTILFTTVIAVITSVFTTAAIIKWGPAWKTIKIEHIDKQPVSGVLYSKDSEGEFSPVDFTSIAAKVTPTVVHIRSTETYQMARSGGNQQDPFRDFFGDQFFKRFFGPDSPQQAPQAEVSSGSGVIINSDGYIVTNNHVIENANDIEVTLSDNRSYKATVVGTDPSTDLAVIHIKAKDLPVLPIVNSDQVKVGQWVLAVGNPFNLNSTVTAGIVSAKARDIDILQRKNKSAIESYIQTDAAINPGNSGGALVDLQGGLVGINSAIASPTGSWAGYGFAVPSNLVSKVVEDILKYGSVQRGYLGITITSMNADIARDKNLGLTEGVYVDSVLDKSAADDAGIKPGDVITKVDGMDVNNSPELQELIARHKPGDAVSITLNRKGDEKTVSAVLKNNEGSTKTEARPRNELLNELGADFAPIDAATAKKLDVNGGVKITKLYPGKLRQQTNIQEGFIITAIDGKPVKTVDDVTKALREKKGGVLIEGYYEDSPGKVYYGFGM